MSDLDRILNCVKVPVVDGRAMATVYPVGIKHLRKFSKTISQAITVMMALKKKLPVSEGMTEQEMGEVMLVEMGPYILENMFGLLEDCVRIEVVDEDLLKEIEEIDKDRSKKDKFKISLDDLEHQDGPELVQAWITLSFGNEKKWRPWAKALDLMMQRFGDSQISISETLSKLSSKAATT